MRSIHYHIICLSFLFVQLDSYAQFGADFTVVSDIGCDQFVVSVINQSDAPAGNVIAYNYGDGTAETNDTFHIYPSPGRYRIVQTVANGDPRQDSVFIDVIEPMPPQFILSNCKGTEGFVYLDDTLYNAFQIDWGDGNTEIAFPYDLIAHNYAALGTYTVSIQGIVNPLVPPSGQANINCSTSSQNFTLIDDIQVGAINQVEVLNTNSILLDYSLDPNTSYYLELSTNGGSFDIIDTLSQVLNPSQFLVENIDTDNSYYCFRVTAFDPCDGETRPSAAACSVLLSGNAANNQNELDWETSTFDLLSYEVFRDGNYYQSSGLADVFIDTDVTCGINYCYQIQMQENNGLLSISNTLCLEASSTDTPPSVGDIYATVESNQISLDWNDVFPRPIQYLIEIRDPFDGTRNVEVDTSFFSDQQSNPQTGQYIYRVSYIDPCSNESLPARASPVWLTKNISNELYWSVYEGWQNGVNNYTIEKYDSQGDLIESENVGFDTVYIEQNLDLPQRVSYQIIAAPNDSTVDVYSNFVDVVFPSNVFFPNAFTPNGDGLNDIFNFEGQFIAEYRLIVFNRWGEVVFQTESMDEGWDGMISNRPAPGGMYIFNAEFTDNIGIEFVKKGELYLIR